MNDTQSQTSLFELNSEQRIQWSKLRELLPDVETTVFFAKLYNLNAAQLTELLWHLWSSDLVQALTGGTHSEELQDYVISHVPDEIVPELTFGAPMDPGRGQLLQHLFEAAMVDVADSIKQVASKLSSTLSMLPSKQGNMMFQHMRVLNRQRSSIGDYRGLIKHQAVPNVLVILDVSGSMTSETISTIIHDVVALSWNANAHLAIVSSSTFYWEPGTNDVASVLNKAEFGGTHYETLAPLFDRDWGVVVTIADYDSVLGAKHTISRRKGSVGKVLDISLVPRMTFLAECVGTRSEDVQSLMVANRNLTRG